MRYSGHLSSYGIDYGERENDVKKIYAGDAAAEILLKKYHVEYIIVSPEERSNLTVNEGNTFLPSMNPVIPGSMPTMSSSTTYRLREASA